MQNIWRLLGFFSAAPFTWLHQDSFRPQPQMGEGAGRGPFKVTPLLGHVFFQDPNSKGTQELNFTIKETVCPAKEEASLDKCDFKEGGVVRECTATYFLGEKTPVAVLDCIAVEGVQKEEKEVKEKKNQEEEEGVPVSSRSSREAE
ncbi:putative Cathelicidin-related peptide lachesicidin protein, partial [Naja naja]